jgi:hypothetical protein
MLSTGLVLAALGAGGPARAEKTLPQQQLNYGYASLYASAKGLRHSDKIFWVKYESEACQAAVKALSESMAQVAADLEQLAKDDRRVRLDDEGLPEIELRKRNAVTRDRLLSFKPVAGRTGMNFERTLLLSESGALNQLQHLVAELDEADADPERSAVLKKIHATIVKRYGEIVGLLNREYFK